ncbi:p21-activated protein kinase-interacting protein 1-like [Liolophura sinensis]|uniref:p21-activated protein kinase-interacting protein 1-like n=1 Tax=Liolophura sinensis TaxID=3198878 RepID=UPI00315919B9
MKMDMQEVEIVAGTYEELLLGYKLVEEDGSFRLQPSFTDHSHTGCIKTVAISRRGVLASGGSDEVVRLINLKKRTELGSLMEHEGAITCVQFYRGSHLFTASQDKTICIWKSFTWECLRTLRGHKGGVNHVSVHPSGKLALSVGKDNSMQTWNLLRGRSGYITNTKQACDLVVWSTSGDSYIMVTNNSLAVYNTETATVQCSIEAPGRVNAVIFLQNEVIAYGGEGGEIFIHNIKDNKHLSCVKSNTVRIRGLGCRHSPYNNNKQLMVSVSSDGLIKVWEIDTDEKADVQCSLLCEHNTKFRLTCVAITPSKLDNSATVKSASEEKSKKDNSVGTGSNDLVEGQSESESDADLTAHRVPSSKVTNQQPDRKYVNRAKRKRKQRPATDEFPPSEHRSMKKKRRNPKKVS